MRLKSWRASRSLNEAAGLFGLAASTLSEIERGNAFPSIETICVIDGATKGQVTVVDHFQVWRKANARKFTALRTAGRLAARPQRLRPKETAHG